MRMEGSDAKLAYAVDAAARDAPVSRDDAWSLLRALALAATQGAPATNGACVCIDHAGTLRFAEQDARIVARPDSERGWEPCAAVSNEAMELFDLYAPLCVGARAERLVLAHLGQSRDGRVSAVRPAARFITGPEDVEHTHRLRALFDAVVIGAETAAVDDAHLTTRLVAGRQPVRVVLDPRARLDPRLRVFSDGAADTIVVTGEGHGERHRALHARARVRIVEAPLTDGYFALRVVLDMLAGHGLRRVFVEGGGLTVLRFLDAQCLDRLHLTIVPIDVGPGTPGVSVPTVRARRFALGRDVLLDCDLGRDAVQR